MEDIDHSKEIEEMKNNIKKLTKDKDGLDRELEKTQSQLEKEKKSKSNFDKVEKIKITLSRIEIDLERWKLEIDKKDEIIKRFKSNVKSIENNIKLEEKIVGVNYQKSKKSLERDHSLNTITITNTKISNDVSVVKNNKKIIEVIKKEEEIDNVFRVYIQMVGKNGIGKIVMNNIIPSMNNELERLLSDTT